METWAIVTLVLGSSVISALLTFFITRMQVSHSDKRFEKEHERAIVMYQRDRRREVRNEPLLKLRDELSIMAAKQARYLSAAHRQHTHFDVTEEQVQKELQIAIDDWNAYLMSGGFSEAILMQYDTELAHKAEEVLRDFQNSSSIAIQFHLASKRGTVLPPKEEFLKSLEAFERNRNKIIEVQELINRKLEEL